MIQVRAIYYQKYLPIVRSHFHFRRSVIRNKKGRSVLMRNGRSLSVQSSHENGGNL
ncbi:hypothetical protein [Tychonema sp. BBK16]|uniref:hypothetical protein n=1 Tax=Tychonema sp. BBK16 TaxID=2699888 RepID=UPI001F25DBB1|nr:hypothetical protein [Tychonema sp. BBK16]MCF6374372.1 hypothetical protein [Tychonema sp. BBK16]